MNDSLPQFESPENGADGSGSAGIVGYGACGWDYRDWRGPIYPDPLPKGFRGLRLLSEFTDFMEVNATFYHPMGGDKSLRWLDETRREFAFVVKAFGDWTHRGVAARGPDLSTFREIIDPILAADRLHGVLAQYPPSFRSRAGELPDLRPLVDLARALEPAQTFVEVRDTSLYSTEFIRFLENEGLGFVNVDLPRWRSLPRLSTINTTAVSYLRLHGRSERGWSNPKASRDQRYDYTYREEELAEIVTAVRTLATRSARVLVAANNHFRAQAPATLVAVRSRYEGRCVPAPSPLIHAFPSLRAHAQALPPRRGS